MTLTVIALTTLYSVSIGYVCYVIYKEYKKGE